MLKITSTRNSRIKQVIGLYDRKNREKTGLFLIEGKRELTLAIEAGIRIKEIYFVDNIDNQNNVLKNLALENVEVIQVSEEVFERLAIRGGLDNFLAVAEQPKLSLDQLKLKKNPLIIVLEQMEKPGNIGAVLRTADAAGADAVLVCDEVSDLYNPNVVRSSLGGLFTVPTVACTSAEAVKWLKIKNITIIAAVCDASKIYTQVDWRGAKAMVIGSEKDGLTKIWRENAEEQVAIPMFGKVDSLNASVSTAILVYEALRQRSG